MILHRVAVWLRRHAAADRNSLTITIAPAQAQRTFQIELPRWSVRLVVVALAASFCLVLAGGVLYGKLIRDSILLRDLRSENSSLRARAHRVDSLEVVVAQIDRLRVQLYRLAGVPDASAQREEAESLDPAVPISAGSDGGDHPVDDGQKAPVGPIQRMPLRGPVSRGFTMGTQRTPVHPGVDIAGAAGAAVMAAGPGVVVTAGWDPTYGNLLAIDHGSGWVTRYGHNDILTVAQGDTVQGGQIVARVGSTGSSSAPHVHFEIIREGKPIDPGSVFPVYREMGSAPQGSGGM